MKKRLLLFAAFSMVICSSIFAQSKLVDIQKKAQAVVLEGVKKKGYSSTIDPKDQSVNFRIDGILYWVTIDSHDNPMLYTLHRNGIKIAEPNDPQVSKKCEIAEKAASMVCEASPVKAFLNRAKGQTVDFILPMYATSPEEFVKLLDKGIATFKGIKTLFDEKYKASKEIINKNGSTTSSADTACVVIEQKNLPAVEDVKDLSIYSMSVRVVNADGDEISEYDSPIRKKNCKFIQEAVTLESERAGVYKVGVKIYTPNGKLMLPSKNSSFTTISTVEVKKARKPAEYELLYFGSDKDGIWEAGEYKVEFYEDETLIYTDAFNIL